ncbi:glycoside hydrolase family 5 protein [Luteolibacter marinus]|uniref:glycoside hydrolase family 5 protein n=1 Tax=Luteolibacter marinus TaxID=2776705 RepID=UPI001868934E|nr:glycoside hydrolase family 5 protein [Luteolibacter marinus]
MKLHALLFLLVAPALPAEEFVPFQPSEGLMSLRVPDDGAPLRELWISSGLATPGNDGESAEKRSRVTTVSFPVSWWRWREQVIRFIPAHDGVVELDLSGPWAEERPGVLRRQEILWDKFVVTGARLPNGSFEADAGGKPSGWESPWRPYVQPGDWPLAGSEPLDGDRCAASWHGRPLFGRLAVKAGVPVTLTLHARAATVPGAKLPARLPRDTPAHRACAKLKRGVNLGNCWDTPPGEWGVRYDTRDIDKIAAEGFDHLRVPVAWQFHLDGGKIKPQLLAELEPVLKHAIDLKLTVILNWQSFEPLFKDPESNRATFATTWGTIAEHFQGWPPQLYFELINEPHGELDHQALTAVHADAIAAIRKTSPSRILLADPPQWAGVKGLDRLVLPDADDRIIVTVHSYEPFQFTHQQAEWVGYQDLRGITFPGPPAVPATVPESLRGDPGLVAWIDHYNTRPTDENPCSPAVIESLLDDAVAWSEHFGRPIHIGEFGSYAKADLASRRRYSGAFRHAAEKRGLPWAMWDWKAGFGYWDAESDRPVLREALFGR